LINDQCQRLTINRVAIFRSVND